MSEERILTGEQAKEIGEILGINWIKFNTEQFKMGMIVEFEHGTRELRLVYECYFIDLEF